MNTVQKKLLNLFLLGLAGALAAWLLFYTLGRNEEKEAEKKSADRVLPLGMSVTHLGLETPEGSFELERRGDDWWLVAPLETAAEQTTIDGMIKYFMSLEQLRRVGKQRQDGTVEPPGELWLFALEPPRFTVTLGGEKGDPVVLRVGKKNSFDGSIYVKRDDAPDVVQVDGALEYQVDKDLYQLRDKRLIAFQEDAVERIVVHPQIAESYAVAREGEELVVVEPHRMVADRAQVAGMLSALANVRAKEFVSETGSAEDRARFGLDEPNLRVELTVGEETHELWLSRQKVGKDALYYAMRAGDHPIMQLGTDWVFKKVNVGLDALRDKRVLRFDRDAVRTLVLERGDARLEFERTRDAEDTRDIWRMRAPEPGEVDNATLAGLLYRLSSMKAKTIIKEEATDEDLVTAGLAEPEISVEVGGEDGVTLAEARFSGETKGERLASSGRRIDLVDTSVISDLSFEPEDYRPPSAP